ncbi:MAG: RES family NAD+ phosphorylase [Pseudomonadota bacterium]
MSELIDFDEIPIAHFHNQIAYRLIPSKYPPRSLFDDVASHEEFEVLFLIQELTNPRLRNELGSLNRVPVNERPYGIRGCNYALGPFVHLSPLGSRFSRGDYGIYYAAEDIQTAIIETRFHQQLYFSAIVGLKYDRLQMRCLKTQFSASLRDIRGEKFIHRDWYNEDNYAAAQDLGNALKIKAEMGLVYQSVRNPPITCYALFTPKIIADIFQSEHFDYIWDGEKITVALETTKMI